MAWGSDSAVARGELATLEVRPTCPGPLISRGHRTRRVESHLNPQSSHSKLGFHPILLVHRSHFAIPLLKKKSNGLHPSVTAAGIGWAGEVPGGLALRLWLTLVLRAPGLIRVNRCMSVLGETARWLPPCVAAATLGANELVAVRYESSVSMLAVGSALCPAVAPSEGSAWKACSVPGVGEGRMVRMLESAGGIVLGAFVDWPRMTVVL